MTKDDLKTLALLPKVITVLRKLAAEAEELRSLTLTLHMNSAAPAPIPTGGPVYGRLFPKPMRGVSERLPDFTPQSNGATQLAARAKLAAELEEIRGSHERIEKMGQFIGSDEDDDEGMDG